MAEPSYARRMRAQVKLTTLLSPILIQARGQAFAVTLATLAPNLVASRPGVHTYRRMGLPVRELGRYARPWSASRGMPTIPVPRLNWHARLQLGLSRSQRFPTAMCNPAARALGHPAAKFRKS
jgi:hypothetical protein